MTVLRQPLSLGLPICPEGITGKLALQYPGSQAMKPKELRLGAKAVLCPPERPALETGRGPAVPVWKPPCLPPEEGRPLTSPPCRLLLFASHSLGNCSAWILPGLDLIFHL